MKTRDGKNERAAENHSSLMPRIRPVNIDSAHFKRPTVRSTLPDPSTQFAELYQSMLVLPSGAAAEERLALGQDVLKFRHRPARTR